MEKIQTGSQKITPFLWFDGNAEEAANFYVSIFKNSSVNQISRYPENSPGPAGSVMIVNFKLDGQNFIALNAGPMYKFTEAISFMVNCDTQDEIDYFWEKLSDGGKEAECGWLKDRFGLSWQIEPSTLGELLNTGDKEKSSRVLHALWSMKKIDIQKLKDARDAK